MEGPDGSGALPLLSDAFGDGRLLCLVSSHVIVSGHRRSSALCRYFE